MTARDDRTEVLPIVSPLKVIDHRTIKKGSGWWLAVVLVESWGKRNIGLYMWQRKKDGRWHRKQKFTIHTQEKWDLISEAVEELIKDMH
ncbi:MAG: hypothetical protein PHS93_00710 [Candidatus Omnitrophica bacterium]|nr:hypothetical protein [Candidatus Omnitrophota bacterium]MDD5351673.1 hypothetical protein [Candidatus Omnitrophota bacterium]MDD5550883.1 hypothetical protein [Candidatus Omnitrophota bacterium]